MAQDTATQTLPVGHSPATALRGLDAILAEAGRAMQVLAGVAQAGRPNPAGRQAVETKLTDAERRHAAGLMRVNHVGEVCAQALYRGQAVFCDDPATRQLLLHAAAEEVDHLAWCRDRLNELQSRPSYLNPFWYAGSFALGVAAGRAGKARNLGFMAETEAQVEQHLDGHLTQLPESDDRSRRIVEQMRADEIDHRTTAQREGAQRLPLPIRLGMRAMSKVMTVTAYRL